MLETSLKTANELAARRERIITELTMQLDQLVVMSSATPWPSAAVLAAPTTTMDVGATVTTEESASVAAAGASTTTAVTVPVFESSLIL